MKKKNILCVDDEEFNRDFYRDFLTTRGYKVTTAKNGKEALKALDKDSFHLILLDIVMPVMDGVETLQELKKKKPKKKQGPIYLLTVLGQTDVEKKVQGLGVTGFLMKADLSPEEFYDRVEQILK